MEEFLASALTGLPEAGAFAVRAGAVSLAAGGLVFLIQRSEFGRRAVSGFARAVSVLIAALLLVMVFLSGLQILLRNAFDTGLLWIDPLLRHLVLLLAFSGALIATGAKRHVQISVLGRLLRGVPSRVAGALVAAVAATICLLLAHAGLSLLSEEIEFGDVVFLDVPAWVVALVFPTAFLTMSFQFFHLVFRELAGEAPRLEEERFTVEESPRPDAAGTDGASS